MDINHNASHMWCIMPALHTNIPLLKLTVKYHFDGHDTLKIYGYSFWHNWKLLVQSAKCQKTVNVFTVHWSTLRWTTHITHLLKSGEQKYNLTYALFGGKWIEGKLSHIIQRVKQKIGPQETAWHNWNSDISKFHMM